MSIRATLAHEYDGHRQFRGTPLVNGSWNDDIKQIADNTGIPEWKIKRIKEHVFLNTHDLDYGLGNARFDPNYDMYLAWVRLTNGDFTENDIHLLDHEYYESRFEAILKLTIGPHMMQPLKVVENGKRDKGEKNGNMHDFNEKA